MDLKGVLIKHKVYGEGVITKHDDRYLTVAFSIEDKRFAFPDALESYLTVVDENIAELINAEIFNKNQIGLEKARKENTISDNGQKRNHRILSRPLLSSRGEQASISSNTIDIDLILEEFFEKGKTPFSINSEQKDKIMEIVEKRKIEQLTHFTRLENLHSILENGLVPVSIQQNMKIPSVHNDEQRIDSKLDCTSCSVEFPNYKLFYFFRENKFPGTRWVVVVLNKDVLFSPKNISYYYHTNAASFSRLSSIKELSTANAFQNMFCESITM